MAVLKVWYSKGETIAGCPGSYETIRVDFGQQESVEPGETEEEAYQRCKARVVEVVERDAAEIRRQIKEGR